MGNSQLEKNICPVSTRLRIVAASERRVTRMEKNISAMRKATIRPYQPTSAVYILPPSEVHPLS